MKNWFLNSRSYSQNDVVHDLRTGCLFLNRPLYNVKLKSLNVLQSNLQLSNPTLKKRLQNRLKPKAEVFSLFKDGRF